MGRGPIFRFWGTGEDGAMLRDKLTALLQPVIAGLRRISKPGLRVYAGCEDLPKVLGGLGVAIISTSKGLMTDRKARQDKLGGEVLAYIW